METALARLDGNTSKTLLARAEGIQDNYTGNIRAFTQWARETRHSLDSEGITEYFRYLNNESGYSSATIRVKRAAVKKRVRQLFHDESLEDRIKIDRFLADLETEPDTKAPKLNTAGISRDKVLSGSEYRELLDKCRTARQRAFIMFLYATGCRVAELAGVRLDRCEIQGVTVKIRILGKGSKERFVKIPAETFETIRETFQGTTYLFETRNGRAYNTDYVSAQIKKIGKLIGRNISAHSLRHTWATRMIEAFPGKIDAISKYMGHANIATTMAFYNHSQLTDAELFGDTIAV